MWLRTLIVQFVGGVLAAAWHTYWWLAPYKLLCYYQREAWDNFCHLMTLQLIMLPVLVLPCILYLIVTKNLRAWQKAYELAAVAGFLLSVCLTGLALYIGGTSDFKPC